MDKLSDKELFLNLQSDDEHAFEKLFHKYYAPLCLYVCHFLGNKEKAEEIVQELFVKIWIKRHALNIETSVENYLFRSVKNQCLNEVQHQKAKQKYVRATTEGLMNGTDSSSCFMEVNLREKIKKSIEALPEKRREIFCMSREEGMKYREIADALGISVKTVEVHMGLALKQLREMLQDYRDIFLGIVLLKKIRNTIKGKQTSDCLKGK